MKRWTFEIFTPGCKTETLTYYSPITARQVKRQLVEEGYPEDIIIRRVK